MKFFEIFKDEHGKFSANRFVGILCAIALCATMYHNSFSDENSAPSEALVYSVASLAAACLGFTSAEKIFKKTEDKES